MTSRRPRNPRPRTPRNLARAAVVACAVHGAIACFAHAQDAEGPIVINQRKDPGTFGFSNFHGAFDLIYRYQNDENNSSGTKQKTTEHRFEETLTLASKAFLIHPNLVDLNLSGTFGLSEDQLTDTTADSSGGGSGFDLGTIEEYNLDATILRKEFAPLLLYGRRYRELLNQRFASSIESTTDTYGADWILRSQTAPTQFQLYRMSISQKDAAGLQDLQSDQDTFHWHTDFHVDEQQELNADYTFNNTEQKSQSINATSYQSHDFTLGHSWNFGEDRRSSLFSTVNFFDQTGELALRRLHANEDFLLRHTDDFQTHYRYSYDEQEQSYGNQTTHRASAGFQHKLYQSLVTSGDAGVTLSDYGEQGSTFEKYANLNFDYIKSVPFGSFSADASFRFDQQDNTQSGGIVHVTGESHTFSDPLPIIIIRTGIVVGSVLVTNAARTIIYTENIDYTVDYFSDHITLRRVLGGAIADGQTIGVDFSVSNQPSNAVTTLGEGFGVRYAIDEGWLKGVAVYGRFFHQSQTIDSTLPASFTPDEIIDITFGADYRVWKLTFNAEHQIHDSIIAPYDNTRFFVRYNERLSRETSFDLNANYVITNYQEQGSQTKYLLFNGNVQHQLTKELFISGGLSFRDESDSSRGTTDAVEQHLELSWRHRQTEVYLQGRNSFITGDTEDRMSQYMMFGIRRTF